MRDIILRSTVVSLILGATAAMPGVADATSVTSGRGTTLKFSASAIGPPINARIPSSLQFTAPGFTFDRRAVAKRCAHEQAVLNECPAASRIGAGTLGVHVVTPKFTRDTTIPINMYLAAGKSVLAVAFSGGVHVVPATITTSGGAVTLSFNPLPTPPSFPSTTLSLNGVGVKLGTSRVVVTRKRRHVGKHKIRTIVKRTRYSLIRPSAACTGSSMSSVVLGFADGTSATVTAPIAC